MHGGNADTWHNCTYENCTLVVEKKLNVQLVFMNPNLVAHYNNNATPQKVMYKLLYLKHI